VTRLGVVVLVVLCQRVSAQEILWQRTGSPTLAIGGPSHVVGDVNGDGWCDIAVEAISVYTNYWAPQMLMLSGRDGSTIWSRWPPTPRYLRTFGFSTAGDVDQDGITDYVLPWYPGVAPFGTSDVHVCSGRDGATIWNVTGSTDASFGYYVLGDIDLNGDGRPDLLVSAARENQWTGALFAYDHMGRPLYQQRPFACWGHMGNVGDVNGDRCEDFVTCGLEWQGQTPLNIMRLRSGADGSTLLTRDIGYNGMGTALSAGCGDIDFDGIPDFVSTNAGIGGQIGLIQIYSGHNLQPLLSWQRLPWGQGYVRCLTRADFDRDGSIDLIVGSAEWHATLPISGAVHALSVRDGSTLRTWTKPERVGWTDWGATIASTYLRPNDHFPSVLVSEGNYGYGGFNALGRLIMYRAASPGVDKYAEACAGRLARAPLMGLLDRGDQGIRIHLSDAPAATTALLAIGLSRTTWAGRALPLPLDSFGLPGCALSTSIDAVLPVVTGRAGLASGYARVDLPRPLAIGPGSYEVFGQWLVFDAAGRAPQALSEALHWRQM
jgi:hypothetical protein